MGAGRATVKQIAESNNLTPQQVYQRIQSGGDKVGYLATIPEIEDRTDVHLIRD